MQHIRKAMQDDLGRIAEILIFNYRLNFYPIFRNDAFYFKELQVQTLTEELKPSLGCLWVYDDGAVKGFILVDGQTVNKLFVEPVLQGNSIGSDLLRYAVDELNANTLWALEKNTRAIAFYERHGFRLTGERTNEEDTDEYLVRMIR